MSCRNRRLLFTCNEDGFSRANVDAICSIGRSTKTARDSADNYIGDKGIGFKSVFRVADVAWIQSGSYSFAFDKRQRLGTIVPMWRAFPEDVPKDCTSILLQLSTSFDENELLDDIRSFDSRSLVFLRKVKQLDMSVAPSVAGSQWRSTFTKQTHFGPDDRIRVVEIKQDTICQRYLVTQHVVGGISAEHSRHGCTSTEIQLAFPLLDGDSSQIKSQNVYAFLPVRDYGFKV